MVTCPDCKAPTEPGPLVRGGTGFFSAPRFCLREKAPFVRCECDLAGRGVIAAPEEPREAPLEKTVQEQIESYLKTLSPDVWFFRMVVGKAFQRDERTGRERPIFYGEPGVADIVVCARGLWLELEVKSAKGTQRDTQRKHEKAIRAARGRYYVVRTLDEARAAVEATLGLASKGSSIGVYEAGVRYYQEQVEQWKSRALALEAQIQGGGR
jgi:hypothetical protein